MNARKWSLLTGILLVGSLVCMGLPIFGDETGNAGWAYLAQEKPGDSPVLFAPGLVTSPSGFEHGGTFSPDGKEFYFAETSDWTTLVTYVIRLENGVGTKPQIAPFSSGRNASEPAMSHDGSFLVFTNGHELSIAKKQDGQFSAVQKIEGSINGLNPKWHPYLARSGNLYFSSNGTLYRSEFKDGAYLKPQKLPAPLNVNGSRNADAVVAPDESYIIFHSNRPGSAGMDLYISYLLPTGAWTKPVNLGPAINTGKFSNAASLSPDGKYFFFSMRDQEASHIYWVSTSFVETLRPKK